MISFSIAAAVCAFVSFCIGYVTGYIVRAAQNRR